MVCVLYIKLFRSDACNNADGKYAYRNFGICILQFLFSSDCIYVDGISEYIL